MTVVRVVTRGTSPATRLIQPLNRPQRSIPRAGADSMLAVLQFNFPVFSAVLLLVAGILIGYALWIPFRGDTAGIARQLRGLREQNELLEAALKEQCEAYGRLERSHAEQQDEWTYLRTWHQRVEQALEEQGLAGRSIEQGLAALQDLKEHALRELDIERQRRTDLEAAAQQSQATAEQLRTNVAAYEDLQAKHNQLQTDFDTLQHDHAQRLSESAQPPASVDSLQQALEETRLRADELCRERNEAVAQLENERTKLSEVETTWQAKEQEFQQRIIESQSATSSRLDLLEENVTQAVAECEVLTEQRDQAVALCQAAQEEIAALQSDIDSHRRAFDTVERHRAELQFVVRRDTDLLHVAQQEAEHLRQELEQLRAEQTLLDRIKLEHTSLQRQYQGLRDSQQEDQRSIAMLKTDRDETAQLLAEERRQREELAQHIEGHLQELDSLREQREEVLCTLRAEQAARQKADNLLQEQTLQLQQISLDAWAVDELHKANRALHTRLQQVQADDTSEQEKRAARRSLDSAGEMINSLQSQLASSHQSIQALKQNSAGLQERYDTRIEQLTMERNSARQSVEMAEEKMAELQRQMEQLRSTVAELRREREDVLARLRRQTVMLESHLAEDRPPEAGHPTDEMQHDERRGTIYLRRPAEVDDLTLISGVAPVLADKLNDFGVYTYRQIMAWDAAAIEEFSSLLSFRDRIQREDWVGQARRLHEASYGKVA